ncbi:MAG: sigma-70 family RNA polymerase sigma factor [Marinilabiliaceae bacterium]|nr:sigma-70 family RNA polymerase sigma factor [Marinilabiliaceae bacterium]
MKFKIVLNKKIAYFKSSLLNSILNVMTQQPLDPNHWVNTYGDILYRYAYARVNDAELAQDLVQETFLAGLKNLKTFQGKSSESTWLIAILKRKVIDHYRKKSTTSEFSMDNNNDRFSNAKSSIKGHWIKEKAPHNWISDAEKQIESNEFMEILQACIKHLPDKWASCFALRVMEEMKGEEVCKELDITSSNLWVILHRARLQLRECIEKSWI